jgi:hypothetical protein
MAEAIDDRAEAWVIRAAGRPADLAEIAKELSGAWLDANGSQLCLVSRELGKINSAIVAEWAAIEWIRVLSAGAYLRFRTRIPLHVIAVNHIANHYPCSSVPPQCSGFPDLGEILTLAQSRPQIREAVLGYATGGAHGFFKAYQALSYETIDLHIGDRATHAGTKEWLIRKGWITAEEHDQLLNTLLHFRNINAEPLSFKPFRFVEADAALRNVLMKFIRFCSGLRHTEQPPKVSNAV